MSNSLNLMEFLHRALASPTGIVVRTNNAELLRNRLYTCRRQAQDPQFEGLSILLSRTNPQGEVWIAKNGKD